MEQREVTVTPITTSEGVFIGAVRREDLQRAVARPKHHEHLKDEVT